MKVFPEYFDFNQFSMTRESFFTIKRPYINFYKTLNFNFQEYNANIKLQCVHWHRLLLACVNVFGYFEFLKKYSGYNNEFSNVFKNTINIRCMEAMEYFKQCLALNTFFAYHKKYYPNEYFTSEYFKVSPHYLR